VRSFLKKRTKKLLSFDEIKNIDAMVSMFCRRRAKVFWFFYSEKITSPAGGDIRFRSINTFRAPQKATTLF
jgi:hypothetical protein